MIMVFPIFLNDSVGAMSQMTTFTRLFAYDFYVFYSKAILDKKLINDRIGDCGGPLGPRCGARAISAAFSCI